MIKKKKLSDRSDQAHAPETRQLWRVGVSFREYVRECVRVALEGNYSLCAFPKSPSVAMITLTRVTHDSALTLLLLRS